MDVPARGVPRTPVQAAGPWDVSDRGTCATDSDRAASHPGFDNVLGPATVSSAQS
ncbi:hypothetical protein [Streptomyces sp. NPDC058678]|uniref:hypothetical protein n=1 Tax=Streptomyces sp. NPDC058678 TaxID=3346595 RepID=UPI003667ABC6